jgi:hypothetical protein
MYYYNFLYTTTFKLLIFNFILYINMYIQICLFVKKCLDIYKRVKKI